VDALGTARNSTKGGTGMASSGKKKTTMAKLARESRLRERRLEKQAKKDARKQAPAHGPYWAASEGVREDVGQAPT
jgi:hypothetical protein